MKLNCQFIDNIYFLHFENAEQSVVIQITCNNSLVIEGKTYYFYYFTLNYLDAWPFQFSLRFQSNFSEANRYFKIESDTKGDDVLRFQITMRFNLDQTMQIPFWWGWKYIKIHKLPFARSQKSVTSNSHSSTQETAKNSPINHLNEVHKS